MITSTLGLVASALGVAASLYAFYSWLRQTERQRLDSERQLAHALRNYEQLARAIAQLQEQLEQQTIALNRLEIQIQFAAERRGRNG